MTAFLTFLKNYKNILSVISVLAALGGLYTVYASIKDSWYQQGVSDTTRKYEQAMLDAKEQYDKQLAKELENYRISMNENFARELERAKAEAVTTTKTERVIEYVTNTVEIPGECNVVPPEYRRVYDDAIRAVNGSGSTSGEEGTLDSTSNQDIISALQRGVPLTPFLTGEHPKGIIPRHNF